MMVINTSTRTLGQSESLGRARENLNKSLARLTSNRRIARSETDPPTSLSVADFEAEIARAKSANTPIENAITFSRTQDHFLVKVGKALRRLSEISMQVQNTEGTDADLSKHTAEFNHLKEYISDIASKTFNGTRLFGTDGLSLRFQDDEAKIQVSGINLASPAPEGILSAYSGTSVSSRAAASVALNNLREAIQALADLRARVGANLQRLCLTNDQLNILSENLTAVKGSANGNASTRKTAAKATANILAQTGAAMVAQAKVIPDSALHL